ncbi:MAG: SCP2 sterol-binding domain-containing protein [Gammaproteobacteria bacterium]|nr:SCP2 sterol-binding domain-containing protein [Gammaproteobacteria bacterium]
MLKHYSLSALQKAINHALALDPTTPQKIEALNGKILQMIVSPLDVHFFMCFNRQTIELLADCVDEPNTTIYSSPLGLIRLSLLPASKVRSLFNDQIRMTGDTEFGQAVKQLFDGIDIDWEGHLAHFTGDVVAHQIGRFMRRGKRFKQSLKTSLKQNLGEYVQEEARLSPPREEIEDFMNDIDALALQVERLKAHINQHLAAHETS